MTGYYTQKDTYKQNYHIQKTAITLHLFLKAKIPRRKITPVSWFPVSKQNY